MDANLQPNLETIEKALKDEKQRMSRNMFHLATPQNNFGKRGIGFTRKANIKSPAKRKQAKLQRAINQKTANKKFRPSGSKKRK